MARDKGNGHGKRAHPISGTVLELLVMMRMGHGRIDHEALSNAWHLPRVTLE